jgi:hypothetical protein
MPGFASSGTEFCFMKRSLNPWNTGKQIQGTVPTQGNQIWRIFAQCMIVYSGHFLLKILKTDHIVWAISPAVKGMH